MGSGSGLPLPLSAGLCSFFVSCPVPASRVTLETRSRKAPFRILSYPFPAGGQKYRENRGLISKAPDGVCHFVCAL